MSKQTGVVAPRTAAFVYDDALSRHRLSESHPMKPERLRYTYELLNAYGALNADNSRVVVPRSATEDELRGFHTPEYLAAVQALKPGIKLIPR